jgi:hypothetical protein
VRTAPARQPNGLSDEVLDATRDVFQPYSRKPLSREDARDIHRNVTGFLEALLEIRRELELRRAHPPKSPSTEVRHE